MLLKYVTLFLLVISYSYISSAQATGISKSEAEKYENVYAGDKSVIGYGAKVYKKHCWICHGNNGVGNGPGATEIATVPANFNSDQVINRTDGELFLWITKGGNDMQPFEDVLEEDEIWKVVNYIRKIQNKL